MTLENRVNYLQKEVASLKQQFEGQPIKRQDCECGKSIHYEDSIFCSNCGSKLI